MKRFLLPLLALSLLASVSSAAEKLKDVVVKPGETVYVRFDAQPKRLRLASVSREPDAQAQVILTLTKDEKKPLLKLRVENKLASDLKYRAEIRSKTLKLRSPMQIVPVVAGKVGYETMPAAVEEFVAFDFAYARYTPAPETPRG
ncbi:MAG: hypothetical protein QG602_1288 [Verrucomicrobiota bacterium]|nr:hypothetical protein [Verrucomicrobiota bacterium]